LIWSFDFAGFVVILKIQRILPGNMEKKSTYCTKKPPGGDPGAGRVFI